jgi:hypothetical protein
LRHQALLSSSARIADRQILTLNQLIGANFVSDGQITLGEAAFDDGFEIVKIRRHTIAPVVGPAASIAAVTMPNWRLVILGQANLSFSPNMGRASESSAFVNEKGLIEVAELVNNVGPRAVRRVACAALPMPYRTGSFAQIVLAPSQLESRNDVGADWR